MVIDEDLGGHTFALNLIILISRAVINTSFRKDQALDQKKKRLYCPVKCVF